MKVVWCIALLGLAFALAVPAVAQDNPADTYKAKCAGCHGADGSKAMMGSKPLNGADVKAMSDADLTSAITDGKGKMPGYKGKLTDAQITGLVGYIRTLQK